MAGEKEKYEHLPIPTYDEAVSSSRPSSSQSYRGPTQVSDDAERQGLLGRSGSAQPAQQPRRNGNYHAPTVESARSSYDSNITSLAGSDDEAEDDEAELRRDMEQMEVADDEQDRRAQQRARLIRRNFQKRFATITNTFSNIHLPRMPEGWSFSACFAPFRRSEGGRFDFAIVARIILLLILMSIIYFLIVVKIFPSGRVVMGQRFEPSSVRDFLLRHVDSGKIHANLKQVAYDDHLAGTKGDLFLADLVKKHYQSSNFDDVFQEDFKVYVNYPKDGGRSVSITAPEALKWTANLEEDDVNQSDGLEGKRHQSGVFHGLSKSGTVSGPLLYANYGTRKDFRVLKDRHIDVNGTIVLMRQYGPQPDPALKVRAAAEAGAIGCLIYSDPAEDGSGRGPTGQEGQWRSTDSVQRGAVSLWQNVLGDVLTPGLASTPDAKRQSPGDSPALPKIPSLPLSARSGEALMKALRDKGDSVPEDWKGRLPVEGYYFGSKDTSPNVELKNEQDVIQKQTIRNIIGRIHGTEALASPDAPVMYIGNHRDAWCFGGVDPSSGTAVFMELVRVFGHLLKNGWRPRRSIVFASWDGADYNLAGSTEHVESRLTQLRQHAIAYLNVDRGVYGQDFRASGSASLVKALVTALDHVPDPGNNETTLLQKWDTIHGHVTPPSGRGDYVPFQSMAGTSSLDLGFVSALDATGAKNGYGGPAFPAQSCHDTMKWVDRFGDPDMAYHNALVKVMALLIHDISDSAMTPLDLRTYASTLANYVGGLSDILKDRSEVQAAMESLKSATDEMKVNIDLFSRWDDNWAAMQAVSSANGFGETRDLAVQRLERNNRRMQFESRMLDVPDDEGHPGGVFDNKRDEKRPKRPGGIPGREQFKHVLYGPREWGLEGDEDERAAVFPGIRDAIDRGDWDSVKKQIEIAADVIKHAAEMLIANLAL